MRTFAAKFDNHEATAEYAALNGWKLETTEPMERGVWASFSDGEATAGGTVYTIHSAYNHEILATANPGNLQRVAAIVAFSLTSTTQPDQARRAYVHNGLGVIAAGLCRQGIWHDILRDNYRAFDSKARAERSAAGYANDEPPRNILAEIVAEHNELTSKN